MSEIQNALILIIRMLFGFYFFIVALRFVLQLCNVNFYNPVCTMVATLTDPPLRILRTFIPSLLAIDMATIVLLLAVSTIQNTLLQLVAVGTTNVVFALALSLPRALDTIIWIFLIAVFAGAILSWFTSASRHPIISLIDDIGYSVLSPIRRFMPNLSGIDLSPIFAILGLRLLQILLVSPLERWSFSLLF